MNLTENTLGEFLFDFLVWAKDPDAPHNFKKNGAERCFSNHEGLCAAWEVYTGYSEEFWGDFPDDVRKAYYKICDSFGNKLYAYAKKNRLDQGYPFNDPCVPLVWRYPERSRYAAQALAKESEEETMHKNKYRLAWAESTLKEVSEKLYNEWMEVKNA